MTGHADIGQRNQALDGLRGVAILLVVLAHAHFQLLKYGGIAGVTLFFVLSGYLITSLLLEERSRSGVIHVGHFYLRRALRLLPALVVALTLVGAVAIALGMAAGDVSFAGLATLLYFINFWPVLGFERAPFGVAWSLAIEEQFYLTWPLFLILTARLRRTGLLALVVALAGISLALRFHGPIGTVDGYYVSYYLPHTNAWALLSGAVLAIYLADGRKPHIRRWWVTSAAVAIALLSSVAAMQHGFRVVASPSTLMIQLAIGPIVAACSLVLITAAVTTPRSIGWARHRMLVFFGLISYGLYLWHGFVAGLLAWKLSVPGVAGILVGLAPTPFVVLAAVASRRWVEQPFLDRKARLGRRWREVAADQRPRSDSLH